MSFIRALLFSTTFLIFVSKQCVLANILAGVTIESFPFVMIKDDRFEGLCVELMDAIRQKTGLDYSLYLIEDGKYGPGNANNGEINGMIRDLLQKRADFAVADMTVLETRQRYVNFTRPFFTFSLSGLIHKKNAKNLKTIDDLANRENLNLDVGALFDSNTLVGMSKKKDVRNINRLHKRINKKKSNILYNRDDISKKVLNERFVFIQEEPRNSFLASQNCNLTVLRDPSYYLERHYAIALPPGSPNLIPFNYAIESLEKEGFLSALKYKYFLRDPCSSKASSNLAEKTVFLYILIFYTVLKHFLF